VCDTLNGGTSILLHVVALKLILNFNILGSVGPVRHGSLFLEAEQISLKGNNNDLTLPTRHP